jgi:O-succinylbenzoate synthase
MLKATFVHHTFDFKQPSGTSRGVLTQKSSYFIKIWNEDYPETFGIGECSYIPGLSIDKMDTIEDVLTQICTNINLEPAELSVIAKFHPCVQFGLETALLDLENGGKRQVFRSPFGMGKAPIRINGLIWMGKFDFIERQIKEKLDLGFKCLKMKIGALNFDQEVETLKSIRSEYDEHDLELRVDANGAFDMETAMNKLNILAELDIHSIEQPIKQGNWEQMAGLCAKTPLDIALDEELIGINDIETKRELLSTINPQYIILKPSLLGGFKSTEEWIRIAGENSIPWWMTSALESNIGLNAISQFASKTYNPLPQGLGTGQLYKKNINSSLVLNGDLLSYNSDRNWDLSDLKF